MREAAFGMISRKLIRCTIVSIVNHAPQKDKFGNGGGCLRIQRRGLVASLGLHGTHPFSLANINSSSGNATEATLFDCAPIAHMFWRSRSDQTVKPTGISRCWEIEKLIYRRTICTPVNNGNEPSKDDRARGC